MQLAKGENLLNVTRPKFAIMQTAKRPVLVLRE